MKKILTITLILITFTLAANPISITTEQATRNLNNLTYQSAPLHDGTPRMLIQSESGIILGELTGPPDNLKAISIMFGVTDDKNNLQAIYIHQQLLENLFPDWQQSSTWYNAALNHIINKDLIAEIDRNQATITLEKITLQNHNFISLNIDINPQ